MPRPRVVWRCPSNARLLLSPEKSALPGEMPQESCPLLDPPPLAAHAPAVPTIRAELPHPGGSSAARKFRYAARMPDAQRPDTTSTAGRHASSIAAMLILLLPALWNRFPLLEYDTGGYLARWFEGYLVPSRSTTYGLFLAAEWPLDFWPILVVQAAAAVWVIRLLLRVHRFNCKPMGFLAIIAALALVTALPWLASELLTDIFAGLAVLAFHALVWRSDCLTSRE